MQQKEPRPGPSRADRFWSIFLFTKDGRVKNPLIIYSFSLSFVLLAVFGAAYFFLIDPVHHLFSGAPAWQTGLAESLLPALAGSALLLMLQKATGNRVYLPASYVWLLVYAAFVILWMLLRIPSGEERAFFLDLFVRLIPAPLVLGGIPAWLLYRKLPGSRQDKPLNDQAKLASD